MELRIDHYSAPSLVRTLLRAEFRILADSDANCRELLEHAKHDIKIFLRVPLSLTAVHPVLPARFLVFALLY